MESDDSRVAPALISTGVQELVSQASRLGLTWEMKLGTVTTTASTSVKVRLDADSVAIVMTSMLETQVLPGDRVYVVTIPPAGNYVIGRVAPMKTVVSFVGSTSASAAIFAEAVSLTLPLARYRVNRAFLFTLGGIVVTTSNNNLFIARLRVDGIAGTILTATNNINNQVANTGVTLPSFVVRNTSGNDVNDEVVLTLQAGAASVIHAPDRFVLAEDIGFADEFPGTPSF